MLEKCSWSASCINLRPQGVPVQECRNQQEQSGKDHHNSCPMLQIQAACLQTPTAFHLYLQIPMHCLPPAPPDTHCLPPAPPDTHCPLLASCISRYPLSTACLLYLQIPTVHCLPPAPQDSLLHLLELESDGSQYKSI